MGGVKLPILRAPCRATEESRQIFRKAFSFSRFLQPAGLDFRKGACSNLLRKFNSGGKESKHKSLSLNRFYVLVF